MSKKPNRYGVDSGNFFRPKKYTPEQMVELFESYLEKRSEQTLTKVEAIKSGDLAGTTMNVDFPLPLTIRSFCVHAGITLDTFLNYERKEGYEKYFDIMKGIRSIIESNLIDGASTGIYHNNLVARLLGLADKKDVKVSGVKIEYEDEGL